MDASWVVITVLSMEESPCPILLKRKSLLKRGEYKSIHPTLILKTGGEFDHRMNDTDRLCHNITQ